MSIRSDMLPVVDQLRGIPGSPDYELRRFAVTIRRRTWTGLQPGEGTATDSDTVLTPLPRVRDITTRDMTLTEAEYRALNSNTVVGQLYKIDKITPQYTNPDGSMGGFTAEALRLLPNKDAQVVDNLVVLVGDDGYMRECTQITFDQGRAFGYTMVVKEYDRPRTPLAQIDVTPSPATVLTGAKLAMVATGTFNGGSTSVVSALCAWGSSDETIARVDPLGVVTGVAPGTATIIARMQDLQGQTALTVS